MRTPVKVLLGIILAAGLFFAGYMANRHPRPRLRRVQRGRRPPTPARCIPSTRPTAPATAPSAACAWNRWRGRRPGKSDPAGADTPGMVVLGAATQQLIGIRTDEVRRDSSSHVLRVPGPHRGGRPAALPDHCRGRWLDSRPRGEYDRPLRQEGPAARVLLHARPPGDRAAVPVERPRERTAADPDEGFQPGVHPDGRQRQPPVPDRLVARPGHERPADRGDPPHPHGRAPRQHLLARLGFRDRAEHLARGSDSTRAPSSIASPTSAASG